MKIVSLSDIGKQRQNNQDSFAVSKLSDDALFVIVCDGMGGTKGGGIASAMAVEIAEKRFKENYSEDLNEEALKNLLLSCAYMANEKIFNSSLKEEELKGMGTTMVAAFIKGNTVDIINVGDSRAYLIFKEKVTQITKDHSMLQVLLDSGEITSDQASLYPNKNVITRAIGVEEFVDVDYFKLEIKPEEILLLCTDGFSNYITEDKILEIANGADFDCLAQSAISFANDEGGRDNITVVAVKL